jgi:hypothetical protein
MFFLAQWRWLAILIVTQPFQEVINVKLKGNNPINLTIVYKGCNEQEQSTYLLSALLGKYRLTWS